MHGNQRVLWLVESAVFAAIAIVLSLLPTNLGASFTVSLGMIPLTIISLRGGLKVGLLTGFLWGVLHFVTGDVFFLGPVQVIIEYIVAFTFGGLAGYFAYNFKAARRVEVKIAQAAFLGTAARFFWHFVAGYIYWGQYAPVGWSPLWFSLIMNGISALMTALVTTIVTLLIYRQRPQIFTSHRPLP